MHSVLHWRLRGVAGPLEATFSEVKPSGITQASSGYLYATRRRHDPTSPWMVWTSLLDTGNGQNTIKSDTVPDGQHLQNVDGTCFHCVSSPDGQVRTSDHPLARA
jgi:hypothetical protein